MRITVPSTTPRALTGALVLAAALALPSTTAAQAGAPAGVAPGQGRTLELGVDAGATFALGDQSGFNITLPASRFRAGFFFPNNPLYSLEPAAGLSYSKVEEVDGILRYDLELGLLRHFRPFVVATEGGDDIIARVRSAYVRPFVGIAGFSGGDADDSEVSLGAGLGVKVPWRRFLAWRLEANLGYGLDNEAARIGVLAGLSFFTRGGR